MKESLERELVDRYPSFFPDYRKPGTSMEHGFTCGDGWFQIVRDYCYQLAEECKLNPALAEMVRIDQIKEKFGLLRINLGDGDLVAYRMAHLAEKESAKICERCGCGDDTVSTNKHGYLQTLCAECRAITKDPVCCP